MTNGLNLEASTARAEALASLEKAFKTCGIENPEREARISLCAGSGLSPAALIVDPRKPLGSVAWKVQEVAARRVVGEPLSRIVGKREFWGLSFAVTPHVLDPRPETETIVEAALSILSNRRKDPVRILDLGVGSGALLCALLTEFGAARGIGVDIASEAADVARGNLQACGLSFRAEIRVGDWTSGFEGRFDLIVSNPPYIPTADLAGLPREVRDFDPWLALDGGIDGLAAYRRILPESRRLLAPDGWLLVELGAGQASDVAAIATRCGFTGVRTYQDLAGVDRVLAVRPQAV
ncbi:MAG: peptide chain release factor N(5)-glutamine methyltransferase [Roseiarcus sp.]